MQRAYARIPAALSSIFSPKILDGEKLRTNPDQTGARGGGFAFEDGVETWVSIEDTDEEITRITINGNAFEFPPSREAATVLRHMIGVSGTIHIKHEIHVPIGTGFGTSAASAMGVLLAGSLAAGRPMTMNEAIRQTHYIELRCKTGLNSEIGATLSGLVLVLREGSPDNALMDIIPLPPHCRLIALVAGPLKTPEILGDVERLRHIERVGDAKLSEILDNPTVENFLQKSREFAETTGLATSDVKTMFREFEKLPVIGYAQNMLGRAVHALVYEDELEYVVGILKEKFPNHQLIVSGFSDGVKLRRE
ncbi:MAG: hypothetical protein NXY59_07230 [Aigarchaeota archaeon]|nr:hypothetical protein [Candidatus Pelearchaeum maunauluense]